MALPVEHDPIALAKTIASLDYPSGGRVVPGAGFGWNTDELTDVHYGLPDKSEEDCVAYLEHLSAKLRSPSGG